jgi:replicative DNA helicase
MSETEAETLKFEFDILFQKKIVSLFLRDTNFAIKVKDLIKPEYFTEAAHAQVIRIVQEHVKVYKCVPDLRSITTVLQDEVTAKRVRADILPDVKACIRDALKADLSNPGYVTDKVVNFARHQAIEQGILSSLGMLEAGQFDKITELFRKVFSVGADVDGEDYDYFEEITSRTKTREDLLAGKAVRSGITTGYAAVDAHLYHYGWGRKELSLIMGAAKSGKSLSLADFAKNATLAGYNAFLASCEVSGVIIADRLDAALSNTMMRDLHKNPKDVEAAITKLNYKSGKLMMRDYPSGLLKPSQINRAIENYRAEGLIMDLVVVDYADIMAAEYRSDSLIENLRSIYVDLRAIAHTQNVAMLTATQTNREGAKAATAKATDIGDDWNKARTADILIGLNATDDEKAKGEARLTWLLSRNTEDGFSLRIKQDRQKMQFLTKVLGKE